MNSEVLQAAESAGGESLEITEREFSEFRALIQQETGIFLRDIKRQMLLARLTPLVQELGLRSLSEYYEYVTGPGARDELRRMVNRITTNKTSFFREPHHFEFLRTQVMARVKGLVRLRIWSAGCSTGEEPYSIAMTALEALPHTVDVRILASDLDTDVLKKAGAAVYPLASLAGIPRELLRKYFLRGFGCWEGSAQVRPEVRRMVTFRQINFMQPGWPIRTHFDAIFCRNVIIYFDQETQQRVIERLAGHLEPEGYLFAGHSESLNWSGDLLEPAGRTVYQLKARNKIR